ncbi:NAD(P)H-hydrate dehydratase [Candidatus Roizmanbacteria bacterium RIFCSPLOWO2_12_FULL_40_12]|uniref:ADP-dependent (S)-NAD(P)H-hydrate dehydratase n=1 Tax=Candidatus Roizmanbacteria bacterium RIFCSPLOWO2_01_FULL_40_42 TaxID=1802066 RepID=A0A1F7J4L5_9BACT|nr:MAG: NAD(P)H-hydrate dehydratase [Candidatus Roizmanbacteria bacterium RIFCSPHIGHO2_01_FULL_40_98]OGK27320.1 MAG: NAD(P)H-hydrate dehydratase [Candidatus Roizmanbacteria bacterium RIFCSPHIGHO2_02_FULL_40_53]OGK30808.1 MAG: NAD(P)H-hydrate dehydratase [Candidatus Roizmanbacteria bacterium RIFCSPHIGHO2_12_41_18]OGK36425.1 MAG: NAD(P)H-hydrate dehydratase [Candidatus Roizmanbacteria bacterium RIFCSPHIGHO2_12_FULL_40_130]OGK50553.1 MAG: NAD(P)H-hydrate dehydratase [Candidatus Roizmanbacteria bac
MLIQSSNKKSIKPLLKDFYIPPKISHKGQNGKLLVIGGSSLFHAASIWAAETASHFVDMVHYSSIKENNKLVMTIKKKFRNGIVVPQKDIPYYAEEDDAILVGPGLVRGKHSSKKIDDFKKILSLVNEADFTYHLTRYLLHEFPQKKIVLDAGSLQMMDRKWLKRKKGLTLLTPHQGEFKKLFGLDLSSLSQEERKQIVTKTAQKFSCTILFKSIVDIVSDGTETYEIKGGNAGLTKGGSGDVLAATAASFFTKNDSIKSGVLASYLIKSAADRLSLRSGYWYNSSNIIETIPEILNEIYGSA